jgi:DNA-binding MarR family transcriptional regulator
MLTRQKGAPLKNREWTFLTNHGRILVYIAKHPRSTMQQIADEVGITLRAAQKIIAELEAGRYIIRYKERRCNRYSVYSDMPMRHRLEREYAVGNILKALGYKLGEEEASSIN